MSNARKTLICASAAAVGGQSSTTRTLPQLSQQPGSSMQSDKSRDDRHTDQMAGLPLCSQLTTYKKAEMKKSRHQTSAVSVGSTEPIRSRIPVIKRSFHDSCYSARIEPTNTNSRRSPTLKTTARVNTQQNTTRSRLTKGRQFSPTSVTTSVATAEARDPIVCDELPSAAATGIFGVADDNNLQSEGCGSKTANVVASGSESDMLSNVRLLSLTGSQCSLSGYLVRRSEYEKANNLTLSAPVKCSPEMTHCAQLMHNNETTAGKVQDNRNSAPKIGHVKRLAAQLNISAACLRPPQSIRASTVNCGSHVEGLSRRTNESAYFHTATSATVELNKHQNQAAAAAAACHCADKTFVDSGLNKNQSHKTKTVKRSIDVSSSATGGKRLSVGRCLQNDERQLVRHNSQATRKDIARKVEKTERITIAATTSLTSMKKKSSEGRKKRNRLPLSKKIIKASGDRMDSPRCGSSVELSSSASQTMTKESTNQQKQLLSVTAVSRAENRQKTNSQHSLCGESHLNEKETKVSATKKATSPNAEINSKKLPQQDRVVTELEIVNRNSANGGDRTDTAVVKTATTFVSLKQTAEDAAVTSSENASKLARDQPKSVSPVTFSCDGVREIADPGLTQSDVGTSASDDANSDEAKRTAWLLHEKWQEIVEGYATLVARTKLDRISNEMDITERLRVLREKTDQLIRMSEMADESDYSSPTAADSGLTATIRALDRMSAKFNEMRKSFQFGSTSVDGSSPTVDDAKCKNASATGDLTSMMVISPTVGVSKSTGVLPSADSAARRSIDGLETPPGSTHSDKSFQQQQQQRMRGNTDVKSKRRDRFGRFPPPTSVEPIQTAMTKDTVDCLRHCEGQAGMRPEVLTRDDGDGDRLAAINAAPLSDVKAPQTAEINTRCDDKNEQLTPRQLTAAESNQTSSMSTSTNFPSHSLVNTALCNFYRCRRVGAEEDSLKMQESAEIEEHNRLRSATTDQEAVKSVTGIEGRREAVVDTLSLSASSTSSSSTTYSVEETRDVRKSVASSTADACYPAFVMTTKRNTTSTSSNGAMIGAAAAATSASKVNKISRDATTSAAGAASPATMFRDWLSTKLRGLQSELSTTRQVEPRRLLMSASSDDAEHDEQTGCEPNSRATRRNMPSTKCCTDFIAKSRESAARNYSLQRAATFQLPSLSPSAHQHHPGTRSYSAADYEEMTAAANDRRRHETRVHAAAAKCRIQGLASVGFRDGNMLLATGDHSAISRTVYQDEPIDDQGFFADTFAAESKTRRNDTDTEKHQPSLHLEQCDQFGCGTISTDDCYISPDDDDDTSTHCRHDQTNLTTNNEPFLQNWHYRSDLASNGKHQQPVKFPSSEMNRIAKPKLTLSDSHHRKWTSDSPVVTVTRRAPLITGIGNDVKRSVIQRSQQLPSQSRSSIKNSQFIFNERPLYSFAATERQCPETVSQQSQTNSDSDSSLTSSEQELSNVPSDGDGVQQSDNSNMKHLLMYQRCFREKSAAGDKRSTTMRGDRLLDDDVADYESTNDDNESLETESVMSSASSSHESDFYDVSSCRAEKLYDSEAEDLRMQIMNRLKGRCELLRLPSDGTSKPMLTQLSHSPEKTQLPQQATTRLTPSSDMPGDDSLVTDHRQYQQQSSNAFTGSVLQTHLPHVINTSDVDMWRQRTQRRSYSSPALSGRVTNESSAVPQDDRSFWFRMLYMIYVVCGCFTTGFAYLTYRQISSVRSMSPSGRVAAAAVTALAPRPSVATNKLQAWVYNLLWKSIYASDLSWID
jgi:hypothetical protein